MIFALELLFLYVVGIFLYTIIVKNDAMHKFSPFTNVKEIAKDGAIGLAKGFAIVGVIYFVIGSIITLFNIL
jgi:hypothetical protein